MAARLASQRGAKIILMNRRLLLSQARSMSSASSKAITGVDVVYHEKGDQDAQKVWPDLELMTLNPYDQIRFPMPGNSGPALFHTENPPPSQTNSSLKHVEADLLSEPTRHESQVHVINQFRDTADKLNHETKVKAGKLTQEDVELKIQDCPKLMRKDFQQLFPGSDVMVGDFTVVSLCMKTQNDMTGWSHAVEEEREALMALYTETANEICNALRNAGFWADFIDPCSGKPHIGPYTTDTMFETDERYRKFGFEIEDLGCCKVIKHHKWGTKSFVGCIFTNAPEAAPVLVELAEFTGTS